MIAEKGGDSVFELFNMFSSGQSKESDDKNSDRKGKMRGPSINLDDIKKMSAG